MSLRFEHLGSSEANAATSSGRKPFRDQSSLLASSTSSRVHPTLLRRGTSDISSQPCRMSDNVCGSHTEQPGGRNGTARRYRTVSNSRSRAPRKVGRAAPPSAHIPKEQHADHTAHEGSSHARDEAPLGAGRESFVGPDPARVFATSEARSTGRGGVRGRAECRSKWVSSSRGARWTAGDALGTREVEHGAGWRGAREKPCGHLC
jgi:hypothetical protein